MSNQSYVYVTSEHASETDGPLYTVGFWDTKGSWQPVSDHADEDEAEKTVHYLNGGPDAHVHCEARIENLEAQVRQLMKLHGRVPLWKLLETRSGLVNPTPPPTLPEISEVIRVLVNFYDHAPHSWGEIEQTVNALDEYRQRNPKREE